MFGLFRRRRPAPPDLLWALDLETDGLDLRRGTILSVGMVPVRDGVVRLSGAFESRVRPPDPASLDAEAIRVHHLVREDLLGAPPLEAVVPEIGFRLEESGRLLVHHAGVDVPFLRKAFRECGRRWPAPEVIDTVDLLHRLDHRRRLVDPSERPATSFNLQEARVGLGLPPHVPHDALADAVATAELYLVLRSRLGG